MKKNLTILLTMMLVAALMACSAVETTTGATEVQNVSSAILEAAAGSVSTSATSVETALAENSEVHGTVEDTVWDSSAATQIVLNGDSIAVNGTGVTVDGSNATITAAGSYSLSGALADGQIVVDTADEDIVRLILNGVELSSSTGAPISILDAKQAVIVLAENTENSVSDAAGYVFEDPETDEPNAAIFSKSDLTIQGEGSLVVYGNYNDGIASKDGLLIAGGTITVEAVDDGIRGKDYLVIQDGNLTINAQGDGLKSDNEEDAAKGFISIENGVIRITSGGDAMQAQTDVMISGGEFTLTAGGGSNSRIEESLSAKGIKGAVSVNIDGGSFTIDAADDAIHSNGSMVINDGAYLLSTGDDGMHADESIEINGGEIRITKSYEGIESAVITINGGVIYIVASDDGINVAGGNDSSGMFPGGRMGRGPGQDAFAASGNYFLYINGGYIVIEASGDGIDANGTIEMTDGVVLVNGPTVQMNSAIDYDVSFKITGGFLAAAGSSGMAQTPGEASSQYALLLNFNTQRAGTLVHIRNSAGEELLTFAPTKDFQSIAFSSAELVNGATYEVYFEGSSSGAVADGLYQGGSYTPGSQYTSFTVSSVVTLIGAGGGPGGGRMRP